MNARAAKAERRQLRRAVGAEAVAALDSHTAALKLLQMAVAQLERRADDLHARLRALEQPREPAA